MISCVSTADKMPAPREELMPGPSILPLSMSCDASPKPLSELWTHYGFRGPTVTEASLCHIARELGVPISVLSEN